MKNAVRKALPLIDLALMPLVYPAGRLLGAIRAIGVHRLPRCRKMLLQIGVFPIRNHYYEPQFDHRQPAQDFSSDRALPGIDWNLEGQLAELQNMHYAGELADLPSRPTGDHSFHLDNGAFLSGDAEYWYQLIRARKPARIFEIGSGHSTLMARKAIAMNQAEDAGYSCRHVCIEPYEMPWLEQTGVSVVRKKVEDVAVSFFSELGENDILFIDSSHIIRPQGDVLFEYLELLPTLRKGVIVHVHDIFSPRNYLSSWLQEKVLFWNEQYLLEAFLCHNRDWEIIGALNYLQHNHYAELKRVAPYLSPEREPGSFYLRKIA